MKTLTACFVFPAFINAVGLPSFPVIVSPPEFEVWVGNKPSDNELKQLNGEESSLQVKPGVETPTIIDFPLERTEVKAEVVSGVVHATVKQIYRNLGDECLNSRYIFPLPSKAAISAMSMKVGNRTVIGEIRTRKQARVEFQAALAAGQSASLLDQERPNVFAMELANIRPGETTEVHVEYSETLSPIDGVYAFAFPAVVGPRYGVAWQAGESASNLTTHVDLSVSPSCLGLESDLQIHDLNHDGGSTQGHVVGVNADVVMKFWFTERAVGAQFLLASRGSEQYFSLAIQPPQRQLLSEEQISKREYLFILDVSGSMTGYPISLSKTLMSKLLRENVRAGDSLNILLFAGGSAVFSASGNVEATAENVASTLRWLDENMFAGGGTELLPALRRAFALPRFHTAVARTIVVMTDGYVTVEREAFDLVRQNLGEGNVFVFGIGSSVNRYLIEGLARVGYGEPFVVTDEKDGEKVVTDLQRYIDTPVLTQVRLEFDGPFHPKQQEPPHLPDVFASRPIHVVGKWEGELSGNLKLTGRLADGEQWEYSAALATIKATQMPAVSLLWARARIATLGDYENLRFGWSIQSEPVDYEEEITALGLNYSLMTQYTSFVAVDSDPSGPEICRAQGNTTNSSSTSESGQQDASIGGESVSSSYARGGESAARCNANGAGGAFALIIMLFILRCEQSHQ
jgi:Ca-activated chloride channel family protein